MKHIVILLSCLSFIAYAQIQPAELAPLAGPSEAEVLADIDSDSEPTYDSIEPTLKDLAVLVGAVDADNVEEVALRTLRKENSTPLFFKAMVHEDSNWGLTVLRVASVNVHAKNHAGRTPLHLAAQHGYMKIVKELIYQNADMHAVDNYDQTAVHYAAKNGHAKIVKELIERGTEVNVTNKQGKTALHLASEYGQTEAVVMLINYRAYINAKDNNGKTPLHLAAEYGYVDTSMMLIHKGANVNAQNKDGRTPLHLAAGSGYKEIVIKLVNARGADVDIEDNDRWTAYCSAGYKNYHKVIKNENYDMYDDSYYYTGQTEYFYNEVLDTTHVYNTRHTEIVVNKNIVNDIMELIKSKSSLLHQWCG